MHYLEMDPIEREYLQMRRYHAHHRTLSENDAARECAAKYGNLWAKHYHPPLVAGGQGRTGSDVTKTGISLGWLVAGAATALGCLAFA